jgi:hypothetical protein
MPDDASRPDFMSRVAQHRAMSDAYRTRAQMARDDVLRKVYAGLASTYENMACVVEQTALRIEGIKLTTARAREKIVAAEPLETDDPGAVMQAAPTGKARTSASGTPRQPA